MSDALRIALATLANVRADHAAARAAFQAEHAELLERAAALASAVTLAEGQCRSAAILAFRLGAGTTPAPGVEIKQYKVMTYDRAAAFAWAKEKGMALTPEALDVAAFEKIAKATVLPFVTFMLEPRALVARQINGADYATAPVPVPVDEEDPF